MNPIRIWTLSRVRFWVQLLFFVVTVYGGIVVGPYAADKITTALPALSCTYDRQNSAWCVLRPFQHQTSHQIGDGLAKTGTLSWELVRPLGWSLVIFMGFFLVLNKGFCGWVCPLGAFQEFLYGVGRRFHLISRRVPESWLGRLRAVKWVMLLGVVFGLPLLAGLGWLPGAASEAWCRICPSRILTTLLTADAEQMALAMGDHGDILLGVIGNGLFGFMLTAAFVVRQPFCRICPMLALHAIFRRLAPLRLVKHPSPRCGKCRNCHAACPMEIPEVALPDPQQVFHDDCTLCGRCVEFCPADRVLHLRWGPVTLYRSSAARFRVRSRLELADGSQRRLHSSL
ncbi:MAG: 4Fe-4S binding protein [Magnetococcales bacterium]|nr:4Fe-4S binding protein [Magnetococcales bacterium]